MKDTSQHSAKDRALFNRIARDYCRKDLHPAASKARRSRVLQTIKAAPVGKVGRILEVGCGAGYAATYLEGLYDHYAGIDYSDELVRYANEFNEAPNRSFRVMDLYSADSENLGSFDIVFMIGVLHHLPELERAMAVTKSLLKTGGWLVVNEPQRANLLLTVLRETRKKLDKDYSSDQRELSRNEIVEEFEKAGLANLTVKPQGIFSTPFAEVPLSPAAISRLASQASVVADEFLERQAWSRILSPATWNVIVAGQKV